MKPIHSILIAIILTGSTLVGQAQPTLSLPVDIPGTSGSQVTVPVNAKQISNLVGFQFTIDYDKTKLIYLNTTNWATGITGVTVSAPEEGKITFVYADPTYKINITDGKFFEINFTTKSSASGNASLEWSNTPTAKSLVNYDLEEITCNYMNGSIQIQHSECIAPVAPTSVSSSAQTINSGQSVSLQTVGGSLNSASNWTWFKDTCNGTPIGTGSAISVSPTSTTTYYVQATACDYTTECKSITITVENSNAETPTLQIGPAYINGSTIAVSVQANGIADMVGFQFTIDYDETKLSYLNTTSWATGITGVTVSAPEEGKITFVYADPTYKINITDGKFFEINFTTKSSASGNASLEWSNTPTAKSLVNYDLEEITCNYINGSIQIQSSACTAPVAPTSISSSAQTINLGQSVSLQTVGGSLNSASNWTWFKDTCNGTPVGTGSAISVSPTSTTTYYVQATACDYTTECKSISITVDNSNAESSTIQIGPAYITGNTIAVSVQANGIANMVGFQFTIDYDETKMTFIDASNWANEITGVTVSTPQDGKITFVYADPNIKINLNEGKFFQMNFSQKEGAAGIGNMSWSDSPTAKLLVNYDLEEINCNYKSDVIDVVSSINVLNSPGEIYPNPFNQILKLDHNSEISKLIIKNIHGQSILEILHPEKLVNTSNLPDGFYTILLFDESRLIKISKMIKRSN